MGPLPPTRPPPLSRCHSVRCSGVRGTQAPPSTRCGGGRVGGNGPILAYCQELARQLVAALRDMETLKPAEMEGLLEVVAGAEGVVPRNGKHVENAKHDNGKESDRGRKRD
jgi:hypothetical protein